MALHFNKAARTIIIEDYAHMFLMYQTNECIHNSYIFPNHRLYGRIDGKGDAGVRLIKPMLLRNVIPVLYTVYQFMSDKSLISL